MNTTRRNNHFQHFQKRSALPSQAIGKRPFKWDFIGDGIVIVNTTRWNNIFQHFQFNNWCVIPRCSCKIIIFIILPHPGIMDLVCYFADPSIPDWKWPKYTLLPSDLMEWVQWLCPKWFHQYNVEKKMVSMLVSFIIVFYKLVDTTLTHNSVVELWSTPEEFIWMY